MHDSTITQILLAALAIFGAGGAGSQIVGTWREKHRGVPIEETAARLDIVRQLDAERTARSTAEHERDTANQRAARAGQERDAADRRAEAADRRANAAQREADIWERHATDVREACLAHGTPLHLIPPRPALIGAAT